MIIKSKRESIKKCLKHLRQSLIKLIKIQFCLIFLFLNNQLNANDCKTNTNLKIGIIENNLIEYQYYLYYELGNYAANKDLEFEIQTVENNINEFDIIFGEYYDLAKLSQIEIDYPSNIEEFYTKNGLQISNNTLPLDLDTFLIFSNNNENEILSLEELSDYYDPIRYTLGVSFKSTNEIAKLINYNTGVYDFNFNEIENESLLRSLNKIYKNLNKNILQSNFLEIYNSYENDENVFTVFSDGIILNKNFEYLSFQLFPQSKYNWSSDKGVFLKRKEMKPYSFFGFSAYLNNSNQIGFLCHLIKEEVRENLFKNFNISISPLSTNEVQNFDKLPEKYLNILNSKNQNISDVNYKNFVIKYNLFQDIIIGNQSYESIIETDDYLNEN